MDSNYLERRQRLEEDYKRAETDEERFRISAEIRMLDENNKKAA